MATNRIRMRNTVITINDNTTNSLEIKFDEGDFQWTKNTPRTYVLDRGDLDTVEDADQVPMDVQFEGRFDYFRGDGSAVSLNDALYGEGTASSWESTSADIDGQECAPYCTDITLVNTPECSGDIDNAVETITFPQFRPEQCQFSVQNGTLSVTGKCNVIGPTSVRSAAA